MANTEATQYLAASRENTTENIFQPKWIGVDWGTSNLRAFAIDKHDSIVAEVESNKGMGTLKPEEFEEALISVIDLWLVANRTIPILACGMVGARQGWKEAQYKRVPCQPVNFHGLTEVDTIDARISVHILPGLSQLTPADVMRGEETQLAGLLERYDRFTGTVCLPGTHSKWVSMNDGVVVNFRTFMTGELFSLLSKQSVLRHSLSFGEWDVPLFLSSALEAIERADSTFSDFFSIRASSLLSDLNPIAAQSKLSGLLIGQELSDAREYWNSKNVAVIGADEIASLYVDTLSELGVSVSMIDSKQATFDGLKHAANALLEKIK